MVNLSRSAACSWLACATFSLGRLTDAMYTADDLVMDSEFNIGRRWPRAGSCGMKGEGKAHRRFLPFKLVHRSLLKFFQYLQHLLL